MARRRNAAKFPWDKKSEKTKEEGERIGRAQYHQSMRSFAKEILKDAAKQYDSYDDAREDIDERIHETADGTSWVIYTGENLDVMKYSDNWLAAEEEGVVEPGDLSTILPVYAYYAVRRDIEEYVDAHSDEYFKE